MEFCLHIEPENTNWFYTLVFNFFIKEFLQNVKQYKTNRIYIRTTKVGLLNRKKIKMIYRQHEKWQLANPSL